MRLRAYIITLLLLVFVVPSHAVLKEADLENTLTILRQELTNYYKEQQRQSETNKVARRAVFGELIKIVQRSNQNALMLYSQKPDYVFDLTYACHEATEMYNSFKRTIQPFREVIEEYDYEIARYDSLVMNLNTMPTLMLTEKAATDRSVCLTLAINIKRTLEENRQSMNDYINYYHDTEERLRSLNDYASKRYDEIQNNIFVNGGESYFRILSRLPAHLSETKETVANKYEPYQKVTSQWDSRIILLLFVMMLGFWILSMTINFIALRYLMPKRFRSDNYLSKRKYIMMTTTVITFAVILFVARMASSQNFIIMASGLLMQYAWLLGVILISLLLRLDGQEIRSAFHIYLPLLVVGFIVITFRVILIPNDLVNLIFPPILLICLLWQWWVIRHHNDNVPKSDVFYTYISLIVFVAAVISSWMGYTLLSVQMLIWWIMQLTCILTITCVSQWVRKYGERHDIENQSITKTWKYHLLYRVVLPTMGVGNKFNTLLRRVFDGVFC